MTDMIHQKKGRYAPAMDRNSKLLGSSIIMNRLTGTTRLKTGSTYCPLFPVNRTVETASLVRGISISFYMQEKKGPLRVIFEHNVRHYVGIRACDQYTSKFSPSQRLKTWWHRRNQCPSTNLGLSCLIFIEM